MALISREDQLMLRLRAAFQIEARESVDSLAAQLLALEKNAPGLLASPDTIVLPNVAVETVFREAHNLKGAARAVNIVAVEALCQPLESVFSVWKKSADASDSGVSAEVLRATLLPQAFDTLHTTLKAITQVLDAELAGQAVPDVHGIAQQLVALSQGEIVPPVSSERREVTPDRRSIEERRREDEDRRREAEERRAEERRREEDRRFLTENPPEVEQRQQVGNRRRQERRVKLPDRRDYEVDRRYKQDRRDHEERRGLSAIPLSASSGERREPLGKAPELQTVRIAITKLDTLLLQAEELLTAKQAARRQNQTVRQLAEQLALQENEWAKILPALRTLIENEAPKSSALLDFIEWHRAHLKKMQDTSHSLTAQLSADRRALNGLIDGLLEDTKKLLMLPAAALLMQFSRTVRDVARQRGKEVDFFTEGGDVEVDKRILEAIKAPLLHLLRNAVDHGIETPEQRLAQGKPECATIELGVVQYGGEVEFRVKDDGAGLNTAKIKERALQRGLLSAEAAMHITDNAVAHLIFASDFSTNEQVDELSGRGLGMAIVRDQVERLGGRVTLQTMPQQGTTFYLALPQTLATFRGLLVGAGSQTFVLPTADVTQVARVRRETIRLIGARETVRLNGRTLRLIALTEALGLPPAPDEDSRWQMVVVLGGERGIAFGVDAILDEQEVLVKRLGWPLAQLRSVTGATVMPDGNAVPILNIAPLLRTAAQTNRQTIQTKAQSRAERPAAKLVLVADDSITSRMLLKDILEASGFRVQTAVDGMDALRALRAGQFDLLVSDIDMPRLDGFELVERLRQEPQFKDLPAVLVTGRDSPEDRERGFDVGASAYVVKSHFDQSNLLEIVRRLIDY